MPYTERVTYNDGNLQSAIITIFTQPASGSVTIDNTGKFVYTPFGMSCGTDEFVYQACNSAYGCCATATVTLNIGDTGAPQLLNVPADLVVECDEEIPLPPQIVAYDACPGIFITFDETSDEASAGICSSYTITRTWEAEDLCGNSTLGSQVITVQDSTPPAIFRVWELPNGKHIFGGILNNVSDRWKSVYFPISFTTTPVVLAQVISTNEASAVTTRLRNVNGGGFQIRLQEQELSTDGHAWEQVAWLAVEPGAFSGDFDMDAFLSGGATHNWLTLNFSQTFGGANGILAQPQTSNESDPVSVRIQNLAGASVQVRLQEEQSKDTETNHAAETLGWLALDANASLANVRGEVFGETGALSGTDQWQTVTLQREYSVPVVVLGGVGYANSEPITVRVRNVTSNSFEYRIQEWDYQNGSHPAENLTYLVMEGSLPSVTVITNPDEEEDLVENINLFSWDNCGASAPLLLNVTTSSNGGTVIFHDTYSAEDACGNAVYVTALRQTIGVSLRVKALLNGAMVNATGGLMRDDLRQLTLIPLKEPYSQLAGFSHKGLGGDETTDPAKFQVTGSSAFVDWVLVELRDPDVDTLIATTAAMLRRDGNVVTALGDTILAVGGLTADYYKVGIRHRNHLGLMTDS
ncbi:MAG: Ig-like domain-containing protein, partial [Planctomycetota bacterium]